jgi:DNA-binding CsgD family transcriptional regulator/tetratricopeptide (TPR) repeat protein
VRSWLSITRRRELRNLLLDGQEPDPAGMTVEELMAFAAWTNECEAELSPTMALAAAEAAVQLFDPHFALKYAETLRRNDPQWVAAQRQKAAAYLLLDLPVQAMGALDDISQPQLDSLGAQEYAEVIAAKARVMVWLPDHADRVPALLKTARERLEAEPGAKAWPDPVAAATNRISLSEFEYQAFVGDYAAAIPGLEAAADAGLNPDLWFRMNSAMILMTALAMTGREMDALSLMRQLGGQISDAGHIVGLRETFTERAYSVLLTAGQWHRCIDLLNPAAREIHQLPYRSAATELAVGLAYVFAGRGAVALDSLLSAVAQLELRPAQGIRREAYAAVAFAYAQLGNAGQARKYLDKLQRSGGVADHVTRSITDFCADMAGRWLNDTEAVNRLKETARRDIAAGRYTLAGIGLLGATVQGTEADFRLLEEVAGHRQGPLAEISRLIAVGTRTHDAKTLLAGGELAATLELDAVEARCMALAVDYARQAGDPAAARTAQARLDILASTVASLPIVPSSGSPLLTSRERQIARLAGRGASNRDIALDMGVSVRTVEGHLYQVFTKLGVTSRGDLTGLV